MRIGHSSLPYYIGLLIAKHNSGKGGVGYPCIGQHDHLLGDAVVRRGGKGWGLSSDLARRYCISVEGHTILT